MTYIFDMLICKWILFKTELVNELIVNRVHHITVIVNLCDNRTRRTLETV